MTLVLLINAVLAVVVLVGIVTMKAWAIRHHHRDYYWLHRARVADLEVTNERMASEEERLAA